MEAGGGPWYGCCSRKETGSFGFAGSQFGVVLPAREDGGEERWLWGHFPAAERRRRERGDRGRVHLVEEMKRALGFSDQIMEQKR